MDDAIATGVGTDKITRQQALDFLRSTIAQPVADIHRRAARKYKLKVVEKITFRFYSDNGNTLTFTQVTNGIEKSRVTVCLDAEGNPKILRSYHITPTETSDMSSVQLSSLPPIPKQRDRDRQIRQMKRQLKRSK